eukprot:6371899-Prymnesium_polylepis.1
MDFPPKDSVPIAGNFNWGPPAEPEPAGADPLVAEALQVVGEGRREEYERLVRAATRMVAEGNTLQKAAKKCEKAIALFPDGTAGHKVLGAAHEAMGSPCAAGRSYIAAMAKAEQCADEDPRTWAECASCAYAMLVTSKELERPEWWEDAVLLRLSDKACLLLPEDLRAVKWRADVLSGLQSALPDMADRSPAQLRAAADAFQMVAGLVQSTEGKRGMIKAGVMCRVRADAIEAHLAQLGAPAACEGSGDDDGTQRACDSAASASSSTAVPAT